VYSVVRGCDRGSDLAVKLAFAQSDAHAVAARNLRGVAQHSSLVRVPRDGVAASEHREWAERVEARGDGRELRGEAMLSSADRLLQTSIRLHEPRAATPFMMALITLFWAVSFLLNWGYIGPAPYSEKHSVGRGQSGSLRQA